MNDRQTAQPAPAAARWSTMNSPVGPLRLRTDGSALTAIDFEPWLDQPDVRDDDHPVLVAARGQLGEYFAGVRRDFDLPLAPRGSDFSRRVWLALSDIPYGQTRSYGQVAAALGLPPGASRAVGAANGRNPVPVVLPCHRVVGADGTLTGYAGGLERKQVLLALESPGLL
jgi:methylated-DNA-[protein]-cysteine S-methyltransferase